MNFQRGLNITGILLLTINFACEKETSFSDTFVYGHAGTTIYPERWVYPPNTFESVIYALDVLGAEGVEVDIQMTKDSVLVLYHDAYLDENTKISGCIPQYNFSELSDLNVYQSKCKLTTLDAVTTLCLARSKKIYLDLKPYHYCDSVNIDYAVFNRSLNKLLNGYSTTQRSAIVVNTRNIDLLTALTDTNITRSFETENISLGIEKYILGQTNELCMHVTALNAETIQSLKNAGINFTIFGVKTQAEIEMGLSFEPFRIITDNIAYTQKKIQ